MRISVCLLQLPASVELELIQSHMAQKPVLRGAVGCACVAREVSVERGNPAFMYNYIQLWGVGMSYRTPDVASIVATAKRASDSTNTNMP